MLPVSEGPLLLLCRRLKPATERLLNFPCPVQAEVILVEGSHDLHAQWRDSHGALASRVAEDVEDGRVGVVERLEQWLVVERCRLWVGRVDKYGIAGSKESIETVSQGVRSSQNTRECRVAAFWRQPFQQTEGKGRQRVR